MICRLTIFLSFVLSLSMLSQQPSIVNGEDASLEDFPWSVSIQIPTGEGTSTHFCGGAIISKKFILTAAHCVEGFVGQEVQPLVLGGGDGFIKNLKVIGNIKQVHIHPKRKLQSQPALINYNDIALIELSNEIVFNKTVQKINLIHFQSNLKRVLSIRKKMIGIAGWGRITPLSDENDQQINPEQLQSSFDVFPLPLSQSYFWKKQRNIEAFLPIEEDETLTDYARRHFFRGNFILTFGKNNVSACSGDSGSILFKKSYDFRAKKFQYIGLGVASLLSGTPFCEKGVFYVNIQNYLGWIYSIIDQDEL